METSYLKAHPLEGRYPEWTASFHSDRSQYSNLCAPGSQGSQSAMQQFRLSPLLNLSPSGVYEQNLEPFPHERTSKCEGLW